MSSSSKKKFTAIDKLAEKLAGTSIASAASGDHRPETKESRTRKSTAQDPVPAVILESVETVMKFPKTLLIGDSSVEWFSRILDPDGELNGDIVGAGRVTYATRKSDVRISIFSDSLAALTF